MILQLSASSEEEGRAPTPQCGGPVYKCWQKYTGVGEPVPVPRGSPKKYKYFTCF